MSLIVDGVAVPTPLRMPYELLCSSKGAALRVLIKGLHPTRLALPADYANDKLKWLNQKNGSTYGNPVIAADYGLATMLINSGTSAYLHKTYGTPLSLINPTIAWDKVNKKITLTDIYLDNDLEETNPTVIIDDAGSAFWSVFGWGTGALSGVITDDTIIKAKGIDSARLTIGAGTLANISYYHSYGASPQDWSAKEFLCLYFNGTNSGKPMRVYLETTGFTADYYYWGFTDNFTGFRRIIFPLRTPMGSGGTFNLASVKEIVIWTQSIVVGDVWNFDRILVDVGQWVKVEAYVPDALAAGQSVKLYSYDPSAAVYDEFMSWDAEDDSTAETVTGANLNFMDDTLGTQIWADVVSGLGAFLKSTRSAVATAAYGTQTLTYSAYYGCLKRIGFAIKMPPDDGQDSSTYGISQCRLKLEVFYADGGDPPGFYGQTTYEFEDSANQYYGLDNLNANWLALFDAANKVVRFLVTDKAPTALKVCADENETVHWLEYTMPAGGRLHGGETFRQDVATDSDGDGVPNFLEEVYDPALVLDLPMDEIVGGKVLDQTANHNDGTLYGPTLVAGKIGNALSFDGTDYILLSEVFSFTDFTAVGWVKIVDADATRGIFISDYGYPNGKGFRFNIQTNRSVWLLMAGAGDYQTLVTDANLIQNNVFYHICVVGKSGQYMKIYVDGVEKATLTTAKTVDSPVGYGYIGNSNAPGAEVMNGIIDEARIYNRALSVVEILAIYDSGRKGHSNGIPALAKGVPTW